jgi:hypothetical protein
VAASINEVSQEEVIERFDVAVLPIVPRLTPQIEEAHQVAVLTMNIPENLDGCLNY